MQEDDIDVLKTTLAQKYSNDELGDVPIYLRAARGDVTMAARLFVEHRPPGHVPSDVRHPPPPRR